MIPRRRLLAKAALLFCVVFWSSELAPAAGEMTPEDQLASDIARPWTLDDISRALGGFYAKHPCNSARGDPDTKYRIAVPHKPGFEKFVTFAIYVFKNATMEQDIQYELCAFDGSYDDLVRNVSQKVFHGAVGDVTITRDRVNLADFTEPYQESGVALLVRADSDSKPTIQWIFLRPLTKELWLTTVGFFFFTGFVVWMIERSINPAYQGSRVAQFSTASYFAFSTLTFSHGQIIRSSLSKVVVVIWCFAVLVLVQSYTANLSSMLTAKNLRPSITTLAQLKRDNSYIGYQERAFVGSFLINRGVQNDRLKSYKDQTEYAEALNNGEVSAIADEIPYLSYFLADKDNTEFEMAERMSNTPGFAFVFHRNSLLVHNFSMAILNLIGGQDFPLLEKKWFGWGSSMADNSPTSDPLKLTLRSFSGLFLITGCVSASMLIISVTMSVHAKYTRLRGSESTSDDRNGESARPEELSALQNDTANASEPSQGLRHVEDNDSQDAHGSGRDEEAGDPMQDRMRSGSTTEVIIQIEMTSSQDVERV